MDVHAAIIQSLENAPIILEPLVRSLPAGRLKKRPASGKWSVHEHLCHLSLMHPLFLGRLDQMLESDNAVLVPYDPGNLPEDHLLRMDFEESIASYLNGRRTTVSRLRALTEDQWLRHAQHPDYAEYTVLAMFRHMALHDFLHGYRIEEIVSAV